MEDILCIGDRLKLVREYLDETQKEFAVRIGIRQNSLSKYERNELNLPDSIKGEIYKIGVSLDWLVTGRGEMLITPPTPGGRLIKIRKDMNLTDETMAAFASVELNLYQKYERNELEPSDDELSKWKGNLNVSPVWVKTRQGDMYVEPIDKHPERAESRKLITYEDDGELSWQQQFPGVFRMYQENKRLKDRVNGSGCSVCKIMRSLDAGRQNRVTGYAEALLQEQQQETDSDTEK